MKKNEKYLLSLLVFLTYCTNIIAQQKLYGHVTEKQGRCIINASVLLCEDSCMASPLISYSVTDKNGDFQITTRTSTRPLWLHIRSLGFAESIIKIDTTVTHYNIVLKEQEQTLNDVVVKARYSGIKVKGDTIKFDTNHFSNGFENNVADILTSLPGIQVDNSGQVSYGGKSINKLLVNGKDMFSDENRGLVIKNMSAQTIEGAEIINNYKNNNEQENISNNNIALNLKTKKLNKLNGYINAEGGIHKSYHTKTFNVISNDNITITPLLSYNNLGKPAFTINDYISRIANTAKGNNSEIRISGDEASLLYRPNNVCSDNSILGALDTKYLSKDNKLSLTSNIIFNKSKIKEEHHITNFYSSSAMSDTLDCNNQKKTNILLSSIKASWMPNTRIALSAYSNINASNSNVVKSSNGTNYNEEKITYNLFNITGGFHIRIKQDKHEFNSSLDIIYDNGRNNYDVISSWKYLPMAYITLGDIYQTGDNTLHKNTKLSASINYTYNINNSYKIASQFDFFNLKHRNKGDILGETANNNELLKENESSLSIYIKKTMGKLKCHLGGDVTFEDNCYTNSFHNHKASLSPSLHIDYSFSQMHNIAFNFDCKRKSFDYNDFCFFPKIISYNEITKGNKFSNPYKKDMNLSLTYFNYNIEQQLYITIYNNYTYSKHSLLKQIKQESITNIITYQNNGKEQQAYSMLNLEKRFAIPFILKSNMSYNLQQSNAILNEQKIRIKNQQVTGEMNLSSSFNNLLNGEFAIKFIQNWNHVSNLTQTNAIHDLYSTFKLRCKKGISRSELIFGVQTTDGNDIKRIKQYILSGNLSFLLKHITIKLEANNILHLRNTKWERATVTPYYITSDTYNRMAGYIIVGFTWSY